MTQLGFDDLRPRAAEASAEGCSGPRREVAQIPSSSAAASTARAHDPEQAEQLARVSGNLAASIIEFCRQRLACKPPEFEAHELHAAVPQSAPSSADRVLRDLRARQVVVYVVVSRARSKYRVLSVSPNKE